MSILDFVDLFILALDAGTNGQTERDGLTGTNLQHIMHNVFS